MKRVYEKNMRFEVEAESLEDAVQMILSQLHGATAEQLTELPIFFVGYRHDNGHTHKYPPLPEGYYLFRGPDDVGKECVILPNGITFPRLDPNPGIGRYFFHPSNEELKNAGALCWHWQKEEWTPV